MDLLNREEVELLLQQRGRGPCISLYMPTQKGREKAKENSIRFKNLLTQAENQLETVGIDSQERKTMLEPAKKIIEDSHFWANQSEGFVYFISPGHYRYYRLPVEFDELSVVREFFHIKPLFTLLAADGQFYVLALSQKDARLLRGTFGTVQEMDLSGLIEKFTEKFVDELPEQSLQFHTRAPSSDGTRTAIYFGHGGEVDSIQKERVLKYFRFIDRELQEMLDEKKSPLLLACVDYLVPLYREASSYPFLFETNIKGNPENISVQDLHNKAWEIIKPYFLENQEEARRRYQEFKGTGKTSNNIAEILPASFHGRISDLFFAVGIQQWGTYNSENEEVKLSDSPFTGSEDLFDLAVAKTFLSSGNVYAVKKEIMPDTSPVAAVLRW